MIDRINLVLQAKNISARQFAEEIGIQPSGMSHIMSGRNKPSLEFVAKVIRRYPEIDANWLLMGRGEMYASAPAPQSQPPLPQAPAEPMLFPLDDLEPAAQPAAPAAGMEVEQPDPLPPAEDPVPDPVPPAPDPILEPLPPAADPVPDPEPCPEPPQPAPPAAAPPHPVLPVSAPTGAAEGVRLERILLVYSDNTFRELLPVG